MKKALLLWAGLMVLSLSVMGEDKPVYDLRLVTNVVKNKQYVFVTNNRAMTNSVSGGALETTDVYKTEELTGKENYVWTVVERKAYSDFYIQDGTGLRITINNSSADLQMANTGTAWTFTPKEGTDSMKITNSDRTLAWGSATTMAYKAYQSITGRPHGVAVYELCISNYTRTLSSSNIGTICLPCQVANYAGADIYQIAYKEVDAKGNPTQIMYELIDGPMQAGMPYVFVPTAEEVTFEASDIYADAPLEHNGFKGTFTAITNDNTLKDNYMINGNSQFQKCGDGCTLGAYRAYLKMEDVPLQSQVSAPTRQVMVIGQTSQPQFYMPSGGTLTPIESVHSDVPAHKYMMDGHIIIVNHGKHYSILGHEL